MPACLQPYLQSARGLLIILAFAWVCGMGARFTIARLREREIGRFPRFALLVVLVGAFVLRLLPSPYTADIRPSVDHGLSAGASGHLYSPVWDVVLSAWYTVVPVSPEAVAPLNALLGSLGVLLAFVLVWTMTRRAWTALVGAGLQATSSLLIHYGASDCPYLLLDVLLLLGLSGLSWWLNGDSREDERGGGWALGAVALALCTVVRLEAVVYLFFLGATVFLPAFRPVRRSVRRFAAPALVAAAIAAVPLWEAAADTSSVDWGERVPFFSWARIALVDNGFAGSAFPYLATLGFGLLAAGASRTLRPLRWGVLVALVFLVGPLPALVLGSLRLSEPGGNGRLSWRRLRWRPYGGGRELWFGLGVLFVLLPPWDGGPTNFCSARYYLPYVSLVLVLFVISLARIDRGYDGRQPGLASQRPLPWLLVLAVLATAQLWSYGHLDRNWTFKEEFRVVSEFVSKVPSGCVIVSRALQGTGAEQAREAGLFHGPYISQLSVPQRVHLWRTANEHIRKTREGGPVERGRCAYYIESAGCWAFRFEESPERRRKGEQPRLRATPADMPPERTNCRAVRDNFRLELVDERTLEAVDACNESYTALQLPVGLYRLLPKD